MLIKIIKDVLYILIFIFILYGLYYIFIKEDKKVGFISFIFSVLVFLLTLIPVDKNTFDNSSEKNSNMDNTEITTGIIKETEFESNNTIESETTEYEEQHTNSNDIEFDLNEDGVIDYDDEEELTIDSISTASFPTLNIPIGAMRLELGTSEKIGYSISPPSDQEYIVEWTSSNPEIVSVDSSGIITANSVGVVSITAKLSNTLDTLQSFTVFSEYTSLNNEKINITYDQILKYDLTERYYIYFNISNYSDIIISKTIVEIYSIDGKMNYEYDANNTSKLSNFIGYFDLKDNIQYLAVGYVIADDGTEYMSSTKILSTGDAQNT